MQQTGVLTLNTSAGCGLRRRETETFSKSEMAPSLGNGQVWRQSARVHGMRKKFKHGDRRLPGRIHIAPLPIASASPCFPHVQDSHFVFVPEECQQSLSNSSRGRDVGTASEKSL